MNKAIKMVLLVVGVILIGYGIYTLITPETSVDLGIVKANVQDNDNSYITIGLGIASVVLSMLGRKS
jgi:hypothetical protein